MSDYTLLWFPEAVDELRRLPVRVIVNVLNNTAMLAADPYPAHAAVTSQADGLYALNVDSVIVHYDVVGDTTVRILMVAGRGMG